MGASDLPGVFKIEVELTRLTEGVSACVPGFRLRGVTAVVGRPFPGARASGSGLSWTWDPLA